MNQRTGTRAPEHQSTREPSLAVVGSVERRRMYRAARAVEGDGEQQREENRVAGKLEAEVDVFLDRDGDQPCDRAGANPVGPHGLRLGEGLPNPAYHGDENADRDG